MKNNLFITLAKMMKKAPVTPGFELSDLNVAISTQEGGAVGSYRVYLNNGQRYIYFNNNWIYIQSRNRFANEARWYLIS